MVSRKRIIFDLPEWDREADVVVIGYGGAGAVTAITAHDAGARVLILEKLPPDVVDKDGNIVEVRHTPSSRLSAAGNFTPKDPEDAYNYQKAMNDLYGVDDVPEDMLRVWAEMMCQNFDWLKTLKGSEVFFIEDWMSREFDHMPGAKCVQRVHNNQAGWGWFGCLDRNVKDKGIEVLYSTPAMELVQNPKNKEVLGVIAEQDGKKIAIKANKAVVMTCGGFEYNMEMQASYLRVWPFHFYCNPGNTGDGVNMAIKAGAALWHMNNVSGRLVAWFPDFPIAFNIAPGGRENTNKVVTMDRFGRDITKFKSAWSYILVDKHGKRFAPESESGHAYYWRLINFETEKAEFPRIPCHFIFDEKTRTSGPMAITFAGPAGPIKLYDWSVDNTKEIARGWIKKSNTIRELADQIGVPPDNLEKTIATYNEYCKQGNDPEFDRKPRTLNPIDTPPYYQIIMWPGGPNTQGGAKKNKESQIVDPDNRPIPRLYGAGEFGSIYGFLYQGGGNTAECIAFGRVAGKNAAAEKPW